jgi:hypothetical protein
MAAIALLLFGNGPSPTLPCAQRLQCLFLVGNTSRKVRCRFGDECSILLIPCNTWRRLKHRYSIKGEIMHYADLSLAVLAAM